MAKPQVTLYFDLLSPFSYIAFHILKTSPIFTTCTIRYTPVLLGDLFQQCQNTPPLAVKNKSAWLNKQRLYWSRRLNLPMCKTTPQGFPFPTVEIQSVLCVISERIPEHLPSIIEKMYHALWANGNPAIAQEEGFMPLLVNELGVDIAKEVLDASRQSEIEERLAGNMQRAFDGGAFGLPWFECVNVSGEKEGFWGVDHIGRVIEFLGLERGGDVDVAF